MILSSLLLVGCGPSSEEAPATPPDGSAIGAELDGAVPDSDPTLDADVDAVEGVLSPEEACAKAAERNCALEQQCMNVYFVGAYGTMETCLERAALWCLTLPVDPVSTYDDCEPWAPQPSCEEVWKSSASQGAWEPPGVCNAGGPMDHPGGAPCEWPGECASGECYRPNPNSCGTCLPGESEPCHDSSCATGYQCDSALDQCVPARLEGAPCSEEEPCVGFLTCETGTCAWPAFGEEGAPCDFAGNLFDCNFMMGYACDPQTSTCQYAEPATPSYAADEEACGASGDPPCQLPATCANHVCTLPSQPPDLDCDL